MPWAPLVTLLTQYPDTVDLNEDKVLTVEEEGWFEGWFDGDDIEVELDEVGDVL